MYGENSGNIGMTEETAKTCAASRPQPSMHDAVERLEKIAEESRRVVDKICIKLEGPMPSADGSKCCSANISPDMPSYVKDLDKLGDDNAATLNVLRRILERL